MTDLTYGISCVAKAIYRQKFDFDISSTDLTEAQILEFISVCNRDFIKVDVDKDGDSHLTAYFELDAALDDCDVNPISLRHRVTNLESEDSRFEWLVSSYLTPIVERDVDIFTSQETWSTRIDVEKSPDAIQLCLIRDKIKSLSVHDYPLENKAGVVRDGVIILNGNIPLAALIDALQEAGDYLNDDIDWVKLANDNIREKQRKERARKKAQREAAERQRIAEEEAMREAERRHKAELKARAAKKKAAEAKARADEIARRRRIENTRKLNLRKFVENAIAQRVVRSGKMADKLRNNISKAEAKLFKQRRELANFELSGDSENAVAGFMNDYDKITKSSKVRSVSIKDDVLTIHTKRITGNDRKRRRNYDLGSLEIKLGFGGNRVVYAKSLDYNATLPHCRGRSFEGGTNICQGNIQDELAAYLSNYEIMAAFTLILAFFEKGCDSDDQWGARISNFPRA